MLNTVKIKTNQYAQLARKTFFTQSEILAGPIRLIITEVLNLPIQEHQKQGPEILRKYLF
jgi:hypothetical protein